MATSPAPDAAAPPGMCPGIVVLAGGMDDGGGNGNAKGGKKGKGGGGNGDGEGADGDGKNAKGCGGGGDGSGCPNHHGTSSSGKVTKGDPVDVVTGRVFTNPSVDVTIAGVLGLQVTRSYSSTLNERDVGLGRGWGHSFAWSIEEQRKGGRVWAAAGIAFDFEALDVGGAFVGPGGWVLVRDAAGYVLVGASGSRYVFHHHAGACYWLTAVLDGHGNRTSLSYSGDTLDTITDAAGRVVRVRRTRDGRIGAFAVKNAFEQGRWIELYQYEYDARGDLVTAIDAEGSVTRYEYLDGHLLASYTLPEGLSFYFRYDRQERCIETWGAHPELDHLALAEDVPPVLADGSKAKGIYHCKLEFHDEGYSEVIDSMTVHRYFGNEFGKVDKAVSGGSVYERIYDEHGHLVSFTNPLGATTTWERDGLGRALRVTDPLGREVQIEREVDGHIRRIIDANGAVTNTTRSDGCLSWVDPIGAKFEVFIDSRGMVTETVAPNGGRTRFLYDASGNPTRKVDPAGATTEWTYDYLGRCTSVRDPLGNIESYVYNARGECVSVRHADGSATRYAHDRNGDIVRIDHADGTSSHFAWGGMRKVREIRRPNGEINKVRYDREGRMVRIENALGDAYLMEYDAAGLLIRERTFWGVDKSFRYDEAGQIIEERCGTDEKTRFEYDLAGQILKRILPDGSEESFDYDLCGRLVKSCTSAGEFVYVRNAVGWIVEEQQVVGDEVISVARTYDGMGRVTSRKTSLGHEVEYDRDICGRATRMTLDGEMVGIVRDIMGQEVERILPDGGRIQSVYDALGRLAQRWAASPETKIAVGPGEPEWIGKRREPITASHAYRYTSTSDLSGSWDDVKGWRSFDYDPAGQIVAVHHAQGSSEHYAYDAAGNLREGARASREYGAGNRLERAGGTTYEWDEMGRLVAARAEDGRTTRYRWNGLGFLEQVQRPDGVFVEFSYDSFGRRMKKRVMAPDGARQAREVSQTRFVWDGSVLVHEIKLQAEEAGDPVVEERTYCFQENSYAPLSHRDVRERKGIREESGWCHYLTDDLGTPERIVGADGTVLCEFDRSAWGATVREGASTKTPLRFAGQYADEETGLVYNRYRYYDPALGRYISADPAGLEGGFNGFDYANNSPTNFIDPDGLMPFSKIKNAKGADPETLGKRRDVKVDHKGKSQGERSKAEDGQRKTDPAIEDAIRNAQKTIGVTATGDTTCSEVDALHRMASDIRATGKKGMTNEDVLAELQKRFKQGATLETVNKKGEAMAPCPLCAQIFRELGIHPENIGKDAKGGVIGPNDMNSTNVDKLDKWDGVFTQSQETTQMRKKNIRTSNSKTPPFTES